MDNKNNAQTKQPVVKTFADRVAAFPCCGGVKGAFDGQWFHTDGCRNRPNPHATRKG